METWWVLGMIIAVVAGIAFARRGRPGDSKRPAPTSWESRASQRSLFDSILDDDQSDDTAPAVLSPPEWRDPDAKPEPAVKGSKRQ